MAIKVSLEAANSFAHMLQRESEPPVESLLDSSHDVFMALSRESTWIAYLFPGGHDPKTYELLTSEDFLNEVTEIDNIDPGRFLIVEEPFEQELVLNNIYRGFRRAFAEFTRWPGVLITHRGDAEFFELSNKPEIINDRLRWLFSKLVSSGDVLDIGLLRQQFSRELLVGPGISSQLKILHLSDLHFGSKTARRRIGRVQELIKSAVQELGQGTPIVPVITGDLLDTPTDENLGDFQVFLQFISDLGMRHPVTVLGNHDVRKDGWLNPVLGQAINISHEPVTWIEDYDIVIASFNSVVRGKLARGFIGENELMRVGNALDSLPQKNLNFLLVSALHHHPIPVQLPSWYRRKWYEVVLGESYEVTEELENAEVFLNWISKRHVSLVLHGHKHIPRFDIHGPVAVVGCGSTTGNVDTAARGQTYMSMNLITIDRREGLIGCRLLAEQIPGAGLESVATHEIVIRKNING